MKNSRWSALRATIQRSFEVRIYTSQKMSGELKSNWKKRKNKPGYCLMHATEQ